MSKKQNSRNKNTTNQTDQDTLLEFPCEFQVKVIGLFDDSFEILVVGIVSNHVDEIIEGAITTRESGNGKYLAVSVTFTATSKLQLDTLYIELSNHERIVMAL